jgi:hypothetical protein
MTEQKQNDETDFFALLDAIEAAKAEIGADHGALLGRLRAGDASAEDQERIANLFCAARDLLEEPREVEGADIEEPPPAEPDEGRDDESLAWWHR